jgi:hypothetical protein
MAVDVPGDFYGDLSAPGCVQQIYFQVKPTVTPCLGRTPAPPGSPKTEKVFENIPERPENVAEIPEAGKPGIPQALVTVLIIETALFRVPQYFVGFGGLFKILLRCLVSRIAVRVVFQGQLTITLFDLFGGGVAPDSENLIVIFVIGCHSKVV